MKPEELRIGNWTTYKGRYVQIKLSHFKDESDNRRVIEHMRPLHLTEEWLEKLGFEKGGFQNQLLIKRANGFAIEFDGLGSDKMGCYIESVRIDILYVHQLQSLWYVLTGEELKEK